MPSKASEIAEVLQQEERRLLDYPSIAARTRELGFPTSTRTLRFYVSEGILPPPLKVGKSPAFREDQILGMLLSICLMKTRFGRSLNEIKRILHGERGDAATLADKCALLYEEVAHRERLQRVEREWLVDAFFRTLTGELELYPRSRRGQPGARRPAELLITELLDDLDTVAKWTRDPQGEWSWTSPEEVLIDHRKEDGMSKPLSGYAASAKSHPRVTPLSPPDGAVCTESARRREEQFLERFDRNLGRIGRIYSPLEKRTYPVKASSLDPEIVDPYQRVVGILKALERYDRVLLDSLPHDRSTSYAFPPAGLFGRKKAKLVLAGIVRSPIEVLARAGGALEPLGREPLLEAVHEHLRGETTYHVFGVLSTVGWEPRLFDQPPRGENFSVVLIEPLTGGGWRLGDSLPKKLAEIRTVFDPEEFGEKVSRTFYRIMENAELSIPGGHVEVDPFLETIGVNREVLKAALDQVEQEDSRVRMTSVAGRDILKRDRY